MINVTKPFSTPLDEVKIYLDGIWERNWFTNNGPLVNELELQLKSYLGVDHLLYLGNGTIAIQLGIKALGLKGKIITTPFSYIATTSSILWENCVPVFADIDSETLNINPSEIEKLIDNEVTGILATHVFGNACDIDAIDQIAKKYNLKVIYDGAHAFGSTFRGNSLLNFGDVTTASFHATKLFHTIEGGAVITRNSEVLKTLAFMRNFGHNGPEDFACIGINGKNSEMHAAVGLVNLKYVDDIVKRRKELVAYYMTKLDGLKVKTIKIHPECDWNCSYFPVIFDTEEQLLKAVKDLNNNWIYPRRYFYPSLSSLKFVGSHVNPVSSSVSPRILCLPLYHDLHLEEIDFIIRILLRAQNY
ncbi:MAG: DegT/DnrJ/EryC1/StrS family aminotransferase [Chitinophagaceae bacterium]